MRFSVHQAGILLQPLVMQPSNCAKYSLNLFYSVRSLYRFASLPTKLYAECGHQLSVTIFVASVILNGPMPRLVTPLHNVVHHHHPVWYY